MQGDEKQVKFSLHSDHKVAKKIIFLHGKGCYRTPWHTQIFQQICNVKFLQERNIFPVFGSKESKLYHVKHSATEQNLLHVTTSVLDKIGRLGYQFKYMSLSNKKISMTTYSNLA